ncbi:sensor histidine kinase [Halorientalis halophila]|uniref:sensor histidine kinase n=1 Tax=Halorientalis halophila TaxID=3108499 RepID=UPI0030091512
MAERERRTEDTLLTAHPDPVVQYEKGADGIVVRSINPAFRETFTVDGAEVSLRATLADDDALDAVARAIQSGDPLDRETDCDTASGERRFRLRNVPTDDGGYLLYTDLGDRPERERELQAEVDELTERNERLETFASVVSHDLRNPIEIAETYLEMAREDGDDEQLDRIAEALERMRTLVEDVLELARDGRVIDETERTSLEAVATDAWAAVDSGPATLSVENGDATLRADPDRLSQAFANCFRNAVEHGSTSPPSQAQEDAVEHGAADPAIRVGPLGNADGTGFFVEDDGPGIPADRREEVLEPGVTTADDGTGLGLAIVQRVVEAHDWTVAVTESESGGARVEVRGIDSLQPL